MKRDAKVKLQDGEYCLVRDEAARRRMHISELIAEWISPHLRGLAPVPEFEPPRRPAASIDE